MSYVRYYYYLESFYLHQDIPEPSNCVGPFHNNLWCSQFSSLLIILSKIWLLPSPKIYEIKFSLILNTIFSYNFFQLLWCKFLILCSMFLVGSFVFDEVNFPKSPCTNSSGIWHIIDFVNVHKRFYTEKWTKWQYQKSY